MKKVKNFNEFFNENVDNIVVANIRYSDDSDELEPLCKKGIQYVKRHGDTQTKYYKLDYSLIPEYGYAPLGEEIPDSFFNNKDIKYIDSDFFNK